MQARVLAAVFAVALFGCDRRVQQCNKLIDAINEEQPKLSKAFRSGPTPEPTPEALESFAKRLDELGTKIKRIELKDAKLVAYRDGYAKLADAIAAAARKTAANFEDRKEAAKAAAELNSFKENEKTLVKQINDYCQGKGS
jgi:hypothetical protein